MDRHAQRLCNRYRCRKPQDDVSLARRPADRCAGASHRRGRVRLARRPLRQCVDWHQGPRHICAVWRPWRKRIGALCQELHRQMVAELRQHIRLLRRRRRPYVGGHLWRRHQHCSHEARRQHGIHQRQQRDDALQGQGLQPHAPHISRPRRNNGGVNVRRHCYHVASC